MRRRRRGGPEESVSQSVFIRDRGRRQRCGAGLRMLRERGSGEGGVLLLPSVCTGLGGVGWVLPEPPPPHLPQCPTELFRESLRRAGHGPSTAALCRDPLRAPIPKISGQGWRSEISSSPSLSKEGRPARGEAVQNPAIPAALIRLPSRPTRAQPSAEPWGAEVQPGGLRALLGAAHGAPRGPQQERGAERSASQRGDIHAGGALR